MNASHQPASKHLPYIGRIREYYLALGYEKPYQWAQFDTVPFSPLKKQPGDATIGIVTTAALYDPDKGNQGPHAPYNGLAKFYSVYSARCQPEPQLGISHIAYDRQHTSAEDQRSYFPLQALNALQKSGVIRAVADRFHGLPTNRSQRTTQQTDCVELVRRCREDGVDGVILVPNCPVCHQSVSLAARALEAANITTVVMGSARDIVEYIGVPRLLFSNFPLGNSAGPPNRPDCQIEIARMAMELMQQASQPRTTWQTPFEWPGDPNWQDHYSNAALLSKEELARRKLEFERGKNDAKKVRQT